MSWNAYYVTNNNDNAAEESDDEDDSTNFSILINPEKLEKLDMIWIIIRQAQNPIVVKRSIDFMIKIHTSLCDDLKESAAAIAQVLIDQCIQVLKKPDVSKLEVERCI